jgi:hypothetical protein
VIYEYLLGTALFHKQFPDLDDRGTGLGWMEWHSDPARRVKPVVEVVPGTPTGLSQLLDKMLEKDPANRYVSYEEVLYLVTSLNNCTHVTQQIRTPVQASAEAAPDRMKTYGAAQIALIAGLIFVGLIGMAALVARLLR